MELNEAKRLVYKEYIKNEYKEMWENPEKSGGAIVSLAIMSPKVLALAKEMERIRDGGNIVKGINISGFLGTPEEFKKFSEVAELCLIVTEIAEAIEDVYAGRRESADIEYVDIIIRAMNGMSRNSDGDLEKILKKKHLKNMGRGVTHGRKV